MENSVLLIVSGGIAAVKCPQLIRNLVKKGITTRCILTRGGAQFVTPLSLAALSGEKVYEDLFSLTDESEMGHIELSRSADLVVVAPATAHILARMAAGLADDLASTALLATDKPVMVAPAMNVRMWEHPATRQNLQTLRDRGITIIGPEQGEMACGEFGLGRMSEPEDIAGTIEKFFKSGKRLDGKRALVTSGPTFEAIDPVRYIANRSSGKQGHAIAAALAGLGADTTLVSGPSNEPEPRGVSVIHVQSAREMLAACEGALPADIAVCAAAVSDWRSADAAPSKLKKNGSAPPPLELALNPDILATLSAAGNKRPALVVGFAAETNDLIEHATQKRLTKGCDWILANDVSADKGTFGGQDNTVHLISDQGVEDWPKMSKQAVADKLAERIADTLEGAQS
ncbi:MAG: bifunctional phosphopantothenoylcysteine decarboxylase/phosphopantothenate--cysteine ligase CoaBC [Rhodospirillaceae bacterium]|nr:bifunctional phosphopantothenoylcysteine decarboxylase/phosphopantothenate--cysteine ligase CoaBC [Rhodospirillaceae bacterium]MBL6941680.1 bifunctional phosphopantothenoylcysteine decarboxylase/phosphopantothenate--cysteine ligase CoaBC [Rhodospirillales bacterium]